MDSVVHKCDIKSRQYEAETQTIATDNIMHDVILGNIQNITHESGIHCPPLMNSAKFRSLLSCVIEQKPSLQREIIISFICLNVRGVGSFILYTKAHSWVFSRITSCMSFIIRINIIWSYNMIHNQTVLFVASDPRDRFCVELKRLNGHKRNSH